MRRAEPTRMQKRKCFEYGVRAKLAAENEPFRRFHLELVAK